MRHQITKYQHTVKSHNYEDPAKSSKLPCELPTNSYWLEIQFKETEKIGKNIDKILEFF